MKERKRRANGSWCEKMGVVAQALLEFLVAAFRHAAATIRVAVTIGVGGGGCGVWRLRSVAAAEERESEIRVRVCVGKEMMTWKTLIGDMS